ncbi:MAG TPA: hypothetical protein VK689_05785, partial [Armatimonadota bacterium]|nr:hypothetical protein [Armatimonadota bacterium]
MSLQCLVEGSADAFGGGAAWRAPEVSVAGRISADDVDTVSEGAALSVLFHNLCLELYGSGTGLSGVQVASLRAAVDLRADQALLGYLNSVRGFVHKSRGARITLYLDLGGMTQTVEFPYGQEMLHTENFHRELFSLERGETG